MLFKKFTENQMKMENNSHYKTEWIIDPLISPTDNPKLYQLLMEKENKGKKIDTDYKYKKNPPKK